jgi:hypothetical protein
MSSIGRGAATKQVADASLFSPRAASLCTCSFAQVYSPFGARYMENSVSASICYAKTAVLMIWLRDFALAPRQSLTLAVINSKLSPSFSC